MNEKVITKEEKEQAEQDFKKENPYWDLIKQCRLLYRQAKLSMMETCMCWGIECGTGWYEPIKELSYRLECINYAILPKWGFVIEAEQVKEKFGTLRFYFTVREIPSLWRRFLAAPFMWLGITKIDAKGFEKKVADGISHFFFTIGSRIIGGSKRRQMKREVIRSAIYNYVDNLVKECDEGCYNVCEHCGKQFAWNPRCETLGWISYVCEDCAIKGQHHYRYVLTDKEKADFQKNAKWDEKVKKVLGNLDKDMYDGKPYVPPPKPEKKLATVGKVEEKVEKTKKPATKPKVKKPTKPKVKNAKEG